MQMYFIISLYMRVGPGRGKHGAWRSSARATFGRAVCRGRSAGFAGVAVPGPAADVQPAHAKRIEPMGVPMGQLSQANWVPMWQLSQANGS